MLRNRKADGACEAPNLLVLMDETRSERAAKFEIEKEAGLAVKRCFAAPIPW